MLTKNLLPVVTEDEKINRGLDPRRKRLRVWSPLRDVTSHFALANVLFLSPLQSVRGKKKERDCVQKE